MEYRRGRITRDYRRWGRVARLARFRARSHSRNAYGGGQTGSFPFSEVFSHYEPSESSETNIRKRPVGPRVPIIWGMILVRVSYAFVFYPLGFGHPHQSECGRFVGIAERNFHNF